jgi:hypothetical protein
MAFTSVGYYRGGLEICVVKIFSNFPEGRCYIPPLVNFILAGKGIPTGMQYYSRWLQPPDEEKPE